MYNDFKLSNSIGTLSLNISILRISVTFTITVISFLNILKVSNIPNNTPILLTLTSRVLGLTTNYKFLNRLFNIILAVVLL